MSVGTFRKSKKRGNSMIKKMTLCFFLSLNNSFYTMDKENGTTTSLMLAVRNNNLKLVKSLLQNGACVNAYSLGEEKTVRQFNVIYNKEQLRVLILPIADCMLKIETHNRLYPHERMNCKNILYVLPEAQELRAALLIDKILEDMSAVPISDKKHPLVKFLTNSAIITRTIRCIFDVDENITKNVSHKIGEIVTFVELQNID
jgi:hypothetical protein